ncbi:M48 family metalloprotease [Alkalicaulis satelles]|uniref:M48 family metalloprotease n=1 Tax=Alkalicaulis satelles TaxID=2609175 RepID=A0A5M6ZIS8_9PROT|nr:M48 family metalloprotease [Alkalicaulis satelles]KAA5803925.1 M48 family metalloprotease [Alkalicaulis satelles]
MPMRFLMRAAPFAGAFLLSACATTADPSLSRSFVNQAMEARVSDNIHNQPEVLSEWRTLNANPQGITRALQREQVLHGAPSQPPALISRTVDSVFRRVAAAAPDGSAAHIQLIVNDCSDYGAEAVSSGFIRLCRGVVERAETEDELAFVIAHEMSHLILGHERADSRIAAMADYTRMGTGLVMGTDAVQSRLQNIGLNDEWTQRVTAFSTNIGGHLAGSIGQREVPMQEKAADLYGLDLLAAAGYSPEIALAAFSHMADNRNSATSSADGMRVMKILTGETVATRDFGDAHPDLSERRQLARNYVARHYPDFSPSTPVPWHPEAEPGAASPAEIAQVQLYFQAFRQAGLAIYEAAYARQLENQNDQAGHQEACASATLRMRHALINGGEFDRDLRRRALAIGYVCEDGNLLNNPMAGLSSSDQAGIEALFDVASAALVVDNTRMYNESSQALLARVVPGDTYEPVVQYFFRVGDERNAGAARRECRTQVSRGYNERISELDGQIRQARQANSGTELLQNQRTRVREQRDAALTSRCDTPYERIEASMRSMLDANRNNRRGLAAHAAANGGYIRELSRMAEARAIDNPEELRANFVRDPEGPATLRAASTVNMRAGPGTQHRVVGQLRAGAAAQSLDIVQGGWVLVRSGRTQGWVRRDFIQPLPGAARATAA